MDSEAFSLGTVYMASLISMVETCHSVQCTYLTKSRHYVCPSEPRIWSATHYRPALNSFNHATPSRNQCGAQVRLGDQLLVVPVVLLLTLEQGNGRPNGKIGP